jgi:hypothetical protein
MALAQVDSGSRAKIYGTGNMLNMIYFASLFLSHIFSKGAMIEMREKRKITRIDEAD